MTTHSVHAIHLPRVAHPGQIWAAIRLRASTRAEARATRVGRPPAAGAPSLDSITNNLGDAFALKVGRPLR